MQTTKHSCVHQQSSSSSNSKHWLGSDHLIRWLLTITIQWHCVWSSYFIRERRCSLKLVDVWLKGAPALDQQWLLSDHRTGGSAPMAIQLVDTRPNTILVLRQPWRRSSDWCHPICFTPLFIHHRRRYWLILKQGIQSMPRMSIERDDSFSKISSWMVFTCVKDDGRRMVT